MKKFIIACVFTFGTLGLTLTSKAKCYEPTYVAVQCSTQGWDNCVNYKCPDSEVIN